MMEIGKLLLKPTAALREAIACIDANGKGIALVVDAEGRLQGTITDGDIRRAMLAHKSLEDPVADLLAAKRQSPYPVPITAPVGAAPEALLALMRDRVIHQVPLVDAQGRVAGLATLDDLLPSRELPVRAVIMAGGEGTRLRPLTEATPKPMLEVAGRPMLEHILNQLRDSGIRQVNISTHYLADQIKSHFQDGRAFGVNLSYVTEERPLGTAGALHLLESPQEPLLVINGDVLTGLDFRAMLQFHREHRAEATVGVRKYDFNVPYGVVETDGVNVQAIQEKPTYHFFVNAGVYLLEPAAHACIPANQRFDMTDLIKLLLRNGRTVASFPIHEYWLDIGQPAQFEQAQADARAGKFRV